jgi:putative ABC transport system permease protein
VPRAGAGAARRSCARSTASRWHLTNQGDSWQAAGLDPAATDGILDLDVRAESLDAVRGDGIAVSDALAGHVAVRIGRILHARLADATPARLPVVAIYHRANGIGDVVRPRSLALTHAAAALDSAVFVAEGGEPAVARGLDAIARAVPTAVVRSRAAYLHDFTAQGQEDAKAQWVIVALMIAVAALAAFNTGALAAAERRRELVLARLDSGTRGQVIGSLTLEALVTTLAGIGVGAAAALVGRARLTALAGLRE